MFGTGVPERNLPVFVRSGVLLAVLLTHSVPLFVFWSGPPRPSFLPHSNLTPIVVRYSVPLLPPSGSRFASSLGPFLSFEFPVFRVTPGLYGPRRPPTLRAPLLRRTNLYGPRRPPTLPTLSPDGPTSLRTPTSSCPPYPSPPTDPPLPIQREPSFHDPELIVLLLPRPKKQGPSE